MRRPAVEKGRAANEAPLVLGMRGSGGAPYQNLSIVDTIYSRYYL